MKILTAEMVLTILTIITTGGAIILAVNKWVIKQVRVIAKEEIVISQNKCSISRKENTSKYDSIIEKYEERVTTLENSDNDRSLTILSIQKDLESLANHHETTQLMITKLQDHQQDTFKQLINTIQKMGVPNGD